MATGVASGGTCVATGVASGATCVATGVASGGTCVATGVASGGTCVATGVASGATCAAAGVASGATGLATGTVLGSYASSFSSSSWNFRGHTIFWQSIRNLYFHKLMFFFHQDFHAVYNEGWKPPQIYDNPGPHFPSSSFDAVHSHRSQPPGQNKTRALFPFVSQVLQDEHLMMKMVQYQYQACRYGHNVKTRVWKTGSWDSELLPSDHRFERFECESKNTKNFKELMGKT